MPEIDEHFLVRRNLFVGALFRIGRAPHQKSRAVERKTQCGFVADHKVFAKAGSCTRDHFGCGHRRRMVAISAFLHGAAAAALPKIYFELCLF